MGMCLRGVMVKNHTFLNSGISKTVKILNFTYILKFILIDLLLNSWSPINDLQIFLLLEYHQPSLSLSLSMVSMEVLSPHNIL